MENNQKIVSNYIFNVIYNILVIALPLITIPYVSRTLGAEGIGQYGYTQSIVSIFILLGTLGTQIFAQREIAYHQEDIIERSKIFWEMLVLRMIMVSISGLVYGGMIAAYNQYRILYLIQTIDLVAAFCDVTWFFQGMEEFKKTVLRNIAVKIAITGMIFIFVNDADDLPIYVLFHSLALLIGNISLYYYLPSYIVKVPLKWLHPLRYFKSILGLFIPQIAVQIYATLDKAMLGYICGYQDVVQVAYYEQAQKIIKLLLALVAALGTVMLPRMANAFSKNENEVIKKNLNTSFQFVFFLGCPLMIGISAIATRLVPWFYGNGYEPVAGIMIATSPIIVITGISNIMGMQFLLPTKRQKEYTIAVTAASVTNIILNYVLIPEYKAIGAVVASIMAECVAIGIEILYIRKYLNLKGIMGMGIKYLCMAVGMGVGVWMTGRNRDATLFTTILQILVGILIYIILLVIFQDRFVRILMDKFRNKKGKNE